MPTLNVFWFRRDLRLTDNTGLYYALNDDLPVLPLFIFDTEILAELPKDDARVSFIYSKLEEINEQLKKYNSALKIYHGKPIDIWNQITTEFNIKKVFTNRDYEPYAIQRDQEIENLLHSKNIEFNTYKDQVIFEQSEVMKEDGTPYTVFTPYSRKWRSLLQPKHLQTYSSDLKNTFQFAEEFPGLDSIHFKRSNIQVLDYNLKDLQYYEAQRNFPAKDSTSYLSPHLRFGTIGIRELFNQIPAESISFTNELIWREFFMQILFHFPDVVDHNFKRKYDGVIWRNDEEEFKKWCDGKTGFPMVDAGMRQLNQTGYMHNRVRMVVAGFLCKHLLIDWRWGEAYFAKKLLDYELSSNNGNWQWAAGTGCDAAPYFRVFNPTEQIKKFDADFEYIKNWVPELNEISYQPIIDHKFARERAIKVYKEALA